MPIDIRLVRSDEPLTALVDGETVMLSPSEGAYFALDSVGTRIWELLEQPRTIDELCETLCSEYDVELEPCRHDVAELVDQLREAKLLREAA